jgi:hypothetical protein
MAGISDGIDRLLLTADASDDDKRAVKRLKDEFFHKDPAERKIRVGKLHALLDRLEALGKAEDDGE